MERVRVRVRVASVASHLGRVGAGFILPTWSAGRSPSEMLPREATADMSPGREALATRRREHERRRAVLPCEQRALCERDLPATSARATQPDVLRVKGSLAASSADSAPLAARRAGGGAPAPPPPPSPSQSTAAPTW